MNKYILVNLSYTTNSQVESVMDERILKEVPYSAKYKLDNNITEYHNILLEKMSYQQDEEWTRYIEVLLKGLNNFRGDIDAQYTLYTILKPILKLPVKALSIMVIGTFTDDKFGIFYTDGSSSKNKDAASYGCCKLLNESSTGEYDDFTNKKYEYETFSGTISNGTNNVGELTGIKIALNNLNDKPYQIIISDSGYSIKTFREYIYTWRKNGYKTYSNKEIKNKDLIISSYSDMEDQWKRGKIILYKWTKGHANNPFNEICDKLAKEKLGIKKEK